MKKGTALMMLAMAEMMNKSHEITAQGSVSTSRERQPNPIKEPTPFKEQEGVKKLIEEYILIKKGESKKGQLKQNRVIQKVKEYLGKGMLTNEDLTPSK